MRNERFRTQRARRLNPRHREGGLSLVELMISITLGLLVLAAVITVFANASAARAEIERTSRQIENGRFASETLTDDLKVAGFYGELDTSGFAVPGVLPDPCSLNAADWNSAIPYHVQAYDKGTGFTASGTCVLTNHKANTDVLVIRRVRTCVAGVGTCEAAVANQPYIQVSLCQSEVTPHVLGLEGTAAFNLTRKDCATAAAKRQYYTRIYYIRTDNGAGQNIPTLARLELTGTGWSSVPLVEGIEELNFEYGLDTDGDGMPDAYAADPTNYVVAPCGAAPCPGNWPNVVAVKFSLLARNLEASSGYTDSKTYTLGLNADGTALTVTPGGSVRRHVYSGLARLNNVAGRRETP